MLLSFAVKNQNFSSEMNVYKSNFSRKFIYDLCKITCHPNGRTIRLLLNEIGDKIYDQLFSELKNVRSSCTSTEHNAYFFALNYLSKRVFSNSFKSNESIIVSKNFFPYVKTRTKCSSKQNSTVGEILQSIQVACYPVKYMESLLNREFFILDDILLLPEKMQNYDNSFKFLIDADYLAFVYVLDQDYTKSSKGYSIMKRCESMQFKSATNKLVLYNKNSNSSFEQDKSNSDEFSSVSDSDEESCDSAQISMIHHYFNTLNKSSCDNALMRHHNTCDLESTKWFSDSDSDDDIVYSKPSFDYDSTKLKLYHDSDDDDIIFSDVGNNCDTREIENKSYDNNDDIWSYNNKENLSVLFIPTGASQTLRNYAFSQTEPFDNISSTYSNWVFENPCFADDDFTMEELCYIKTVNANWDEMMKDVDAEPKESRKVSFVPLPDLVSVLNYEREVDEESVSYDTYVLDHIRFQDRIRRFELVIAPYLAPIHRAQVLRRINP